MIAYLDASAMIPRLFREPTAEAVDRFYAALSEAPWITEFGAAEVSSAISRSARTRRISMSNARDALADFDLWRKEKTRAAPIEAEDFRRATDFVRRFELALRTPDALHLAVAARLGLTLVTLDRRLADAATALGIAVVVPT